MHAMRMLAVLLVIAAPLSACETGGGKTATRNVDDASITASVKSKLVADKAANLARVDVDTQNGVVYLNGSVHNAEDRARIEQIASEARDVTRVVNNLQLTARPLSQADQGNERRDREWRRDSGAGKRRERSTERNSYEQRDYDSRRHVSARRDGDQERMEPRRRDGRPQYSQIPPGHLPPPGECRTWFPGVPPGHQPPPHRC